MKLVLLVLPLVLQTPTDSLTAKVDRLFARYDTRNTPGCAVAVARDGRTVLERAYGMADLEHDVPNTPGTIFETGSVAKQFTAAAVVLLAQDGRLSLDHDVHRYFPELPGYGAPVTLRQMLNHTSGFRDWGVIASLEGWPRGTRTHTHKHVLDIVARQRELNFPPGSQYLYSNTNYNLAAMLVDRVSGMSFAAFTRRRLFEPLGMTHTQWRDDYTRIVKNRAIAYGRSGDGYRQEMPFENVHGNGGLLTTVGDLLRWNANLDAPAVGGRALVEELQRQGRLDNGREISYAAGLFVRRYRGTTEVWHDGATAGYRATLRRYPAARLSVAVLCNAADVDPTLGHSVADVFLGLPAPVPVAPRAVTLDSASLAARAGVYRNTRTNEPLRLVLRAGKLALARGPEFTPLSRTRFQLTGTEVVGQFEDGQHGRTARLLQLLPDGDTVIFEPASDVAPTPPQLAEYAGSYSSDEALARYTVAVDGGKLVVRDRLGEGRELAPAYRDAFTSQGTVVVFIRDRGGAVTAMSLWLERVRGIRFARVAHTASP